MGVTQDSSHERVATRYLKICESDESPPIGEYMDMLMEGHHRLTKNQLHAFTKATRKRLRLGKKGIARRKRMAKSIGEHYKKKPYLEPL